MSENKQTRDYHALKLTAICVGAAINGAAYYFVAQAGGPDIPILKDEPMAIHVFSAWAAIDYTLIMYHIYSHINIVPKKPASWILAFFGIFAATVMFTAAYEGALRMQLMTTVAFILGFVMDFLRSINMLDAANKMPKKFAELKSDWISAVKNDPSIDKKRDYVEILRILLTLSTTVLYACCTTDSVYAATYEIGTELGKWFSFTPDAGTLSITSYVFGGLGAVGILAMVLYWTHHGIKQLTCGGKPNKKGQIVDISDRYTFFAFIMGLPMFLSAVGAATAPNGENSGKMFGQMGSAAFFINIISSFIYGVSSVIPPLSGTLRTVTKNCIKLCSGEYRAAHLDWETRSTSGSVASRESFASDGGFSLKELTHGEHRERNLFDPEPEVQQKSACGRLFDCFHLRHSRNIRAGSTAETEFGGSDNYYTELENTPQAIDDAF